MRPFPWKGNADLVYQVALVIAVDKFALKAAAGYVNV